jgi:hypothetical protein
VREHGRRIATPLLAVLVAIETTDIMFALDSIPAVFAVTTDPLVVFSSNLFAILGLRSLYFLLAGLLDRFVYLKTGLAALLVFAGAKILVGAVVKVPIELSLAVIVLITGTAIVASLVATHPRRSELRAPLLRVATGTALGMAATTLFVVAAAVRDGVTLPVALPLPMWLAVDLVLLAGMSIVVAVGISVLRRLRARSSVVRAWVAMGVALLLVVGLFIVLD